MGGAAAGINILKGHLAYRIGIVDRIIKIPIVCCLHPGGEDFPFGAHIPHRIGIRPFRKAIVHLTDVEALADKLTDLLRRAADVQLAVIVARQITDTVITIPIRSEEERLFTTEIWQNCVKK